MDGLFPAEERLLVCEHLLLGLGDVIAAGVGDEARDEIPGADVVDDLANARLGDLVAIEHGADALGCDGPAAPLALLEECGDGREDSVALVVGERRGLDFESL